VIPIADVIRLAAHANHYLAVFDKATGSALELFRARRVASPAQRIMLIARDGGCTKPGVRREALVDRVEVRDLHRGSVAAGLRS
jgi:hypothetical protein